MSQGGAGGQGQTANNIISTALNRLKENKTYKQGQPNVP